MAIDMQSLQFTRRASDYTRSIGNVSNLERSGNACYICSVFSIEQTTVLVAMRAYPA